MSYRTTLSRLEAYEPRALGTEMYRDLSTGLCCTLGAAAPRASGYMVAPGQLLADDLGLSPEETSLIIDTNDGDGAKSETPSARYTRMVEWLRARVAEEGEVSR